MSREFTLEKKQSEAWEYLTDDKTVDIGYGGGAGGGKTIIGAFWIIMMCEMYPNTRYFIGRSELKNLKHSTLATFWNVCNMVGITPDHYRYNQVDSIIKWHNGSEIILLDLSHKPSDSLYLRLGGHEYTSGYIDESNEIKYAAIDILKTRIGRCKNKEYNLKPKLLQTFNPDRGHIYTHFWRPYKDGGMSNDNMPAKTAFIRALPIDNPYLTKDYLETLKNSKNKITSQRLYYGNFDYVDDPALLFDLDKIVDTFTNTVDSGEPYISCDVARFGDDKTVIMVWDGLKVIKIKSYNKTGVDEVVNILIGLCKQYRVPRSSVIVDEDGVGGGVVDIFKGCQGFVNNSKPIVDEIEKAEKSYNQTNYSNLKAQCYYELANIVRDSLISIDTNDQAVIEAIKEELLSIKQKDIDKGGKLSIIGKDKIKEDLGRSPDFADALMMRLYFELKKELPLQIFL